LEVTRLVMKIDEKKFGKTGHVSFKKWIKEKYKTLDSQKRYQNELVQVRIDHAISELREKRGISQEGLAKLLHTKQQYISRIEQSDKINLTIQTLSKLADIFHKQLVITFR